MEAALQTELRRSIPTGAHFHKISDSPIFSGNRMRFTLPKPYDWYCGFKSNFYAIENKVHKVSQAWAVSKIQDHQIAALSEVYQNNKPGQNNFRAYVFMNIRYGLGKKRVNHIFGIHIKPFLQLLLKMERKGRKSIPLDEFERFKKIRCYREKQDDGQSLLYWNLGLFFEDDEFHKESERIKV